MEEHSRCVLGGERDGRLPQGEGPCESCGQDGGAHGVVDGVAQLHGLGDEPRGAEVLGDEVGQGAWHAGQERDAHDAEEPDVPDGSYDERLDGGSLQNDHGGS